MGSIVEDLNNSQYESLKQFRKNVSDILPPKCSDTWLAKWLKSHNYNLKKTEALFRANARMREVYELDTIVDTFVKPEVVSKYEFSSFMGIAKNGTPIRYTQFGTFDPYGYLMSITGYEICLYCSYILEYDHAMLRKENERTGRQMAEITYVLDMEGFQLQKLMIKGAIDTTFDLLQMMQDHQPEMWGNIFIVNAPSYFDRAFNIFKPILRSMLQNIRVASRESSPALLLKYIDEDVLPVFLGGKKTDSQGDPRCSEYLRFGGIIPEEYYLNNLTPLSPTDEGVTDVWVQPRAVYNHFIVIRKPDSLMRVEFRTENGGIAAKMLYREFGEDPDNLDLPAIDEYLDESRPSSNVLYVSPCIRMQSHTTPIDQCVRAPWPGIYIYRFDNTYSWFTARRVIFRIRIVREGR